MTPEDGGFIVTLGDGDGTDDVNEAGPRLLREAVEAGLPIRAFEPLTRSLHEIFLDLTADRAPADPHPVASAESDT